MTTLLVPEQRAYGDPCDDYLEALRDYLGQPSGAVADGPDPGRRLTESAGRLHERGTFLRQEVSRLHAAVVDAQPQLAGVLPPPATDGVLCAVPADQGRASLQRAHDLARQLIMMPRPKNRAVSGVIGFLLGACAAGSAPALLVLLVVSVLVASVTNLARPLPNALAAGTGVGASALLLQPGVLKLAGAALMAVGYLLYRNECTTNAHSRRSST